VDATADRLAAAIDALLAFLPDDAEPLLYDSDRRQTFDRLDEDTYIAACRAGLEGKLPAAQGTHLGYTRLPGWTDVAGIFYPWYVREWRQEMLVLRRLALEPPAGGKKNAGGPRDPGRLEKLRAWKAAGWTVRKMANTLGLKEAALRRYMERHGIA
jgi:hypothetical protein